MFQEKKKKQNQAFSKAIKTIKWLSPSQQTNIPACKYLHTL